MPGLDRDVRRAATHAGAVHRWCADVVRRRLDTDPTGGSAAFEAAGDAAVVSLWRDVRVIDLVTSRHPVSTDWAEIARVLRPGGSYLSQQIGPASMLELSEAFLGPLPGAELWRRAQK